MQIRELLAQPQHLPTIPTLVQSLIDSFADDDVSITKIARLISTDPGMSAKLLRLANSAYFRVARSIGTVDDALKLLGSTMVRNLVIGSGFAGAFKVAAGLDIREFWRYSLGTACAARWLAGRARHNPETAFMVGLLHGIGQFAMRAGLTQAMEKIDLLVHPLDERRAMAERNELGFDHAQVGGALARLWHFPEGIAMGICGVPQPDEPLAALVHLAAWRSRTAIFQIVPAQVAASYPCVAADLVGLDSRWVRELAPDEEWERDSSVTMPPVAELTAGLDEMLGNA